MEIKLRKALLDDLPLMQALFAETILEVCSKDYTSEQTKVWSDGRNNTSRWLGMLEEQYVLVAYGGNVLVGFGSLANHNYLDFLYVHKDYQGVGVANMIYTTLEQEALLHDTKCLTSNVSQTARGFFEKKGFMVLQKQTFLKEGVEIFNFKMEKVL